ncbi:Hnrpc-prov protein [Dirofilaria immitis]|nr:Hnrpc-prov protein [Dirofilaria immitis]
MKLVNIITSDLLPKAFEYGGVSFCMPDTLICGGCRFVTSDFEEFREHRKSACPINPVDGEVENEEVKWQCSMCDEVCTSGGTLIEHALDRHNIRLLKNCAE